MQDQNQQYKLFPNIFDDIRLMEDKKNDKPNTPVFYRPIGVGGDVKIEEKTKRISDIKNDKKSDKKRKRKSSEETFFDTSEISQTSKASIQDLQMEINNVQYESVESCSVESLEESSVSKIQLYLVWEETQDDLTNVDVEKLILDREKERVVYMTEMDLGTAIEAKIQRLFAGRNFKILSGNLEKLYVKDSVVVFLISKKTVKRPRTDLVAVNARINMLCDQVIGIVYNYECEENALFHGFSYEVKGILASNLYEKQISDNPMMNPFNMKNLLIFFGDLIQSKDFKSSISKLGLFLPKRGCFKPVYKVKGGKLLNGPPSNEEHTIFLYSLSNSVITTAPQQKLTVVTAAPEQKLTNINLAMKQSILDQTNRQVQQIVAPPTHPCPDINDNIISIVEKLTTQPSLAKTFTKGLKYLNISTKSQLLRLLSKPKSRQALISQLVLFGINFIDIIDVIEDLEEII